MTTAMLINFLIMIVMALSGVLMGIILKDLRNIRDRLHKIEGSNSSILTHIEFFNRWLGDLKDVHERLAKLEAVK